MHARVATKWAAKRPRSIVAFDDARVRQAAQSVRLATLAHGVATAMLAGVQRTTEMNSEAARSLLRDTRSQHRQAIADDAAERWRFSWRAYQICATTAGSVLELCQTHTQANLDDLWRALGHLTDALAEPPFGDAARRDRLRGSLYMLQKTQTDMFEAAGRLQGELIALGSANQET